MALLLKRLFEFYAKAMVDWADPETIDYPLFRSPVKMITILVVYLLFCKEIGPKYMKNREPCNVKKYIIVYNIFQILANGYLAIKATPMFLVTDWRCSPLDFKYGRTDSLPYFLGYSYFLLKIADLLDTVFFVLKKNERQVTFLHLYHHTIMVVMSWVSSKYLSGGHAIYIPYINVFVHAVMYSYYLLCLLSEEHKKSIWWKKHITQLQIMQFALVFLLHFQLLFRDCAFPRTYSVLIVIQNLVVTSLFLDFYYKTYIRKKK